METLADLANNHKFAKVSSAKIRTLFDTKQHYKSSNSPKFILPTVILQRIRQSFHSPKFPSIIYYGKHPVNCIPGPDSLIKNKS